MPKISVIVPNYNHARFLDQRMETILNQTFRDFEVIFLDDASTDNSLEVFEKYRKNKHITKVIINKVNSGSPFKQWNKGLKEAKGELVWIAESDDYAEYGFLEAMVTKFREYSDVGVVYCRSKIVDEHGKKVRLENPNVNLENYFRTQRWQRDYYNSGLDEIEKYTSEKNTIFNASSAVFKKVVSDRIGGVDSEMMQCGDWKHWVDILSVSNIYYVSSELNYHRKVCSSRTAQYFHRCEAKNEMYRVLDHIGQIEKQRGLFCKRRPAGLQYLADSSVCALLSEKESLGKKIELIVRAFRYDHCFPFRAFCFIVKLFYAAIHHLLFLIKKNFKAGY